MHNVGAKDKSLLPREQLGGGGNDPTRSRAGCCSNTSGHGDLVRLMVGFSLILFPLRLY